MYKSVRVEDPDGHATCHQPCHQASLLQHAAEHRRIGIEVVIILTPLQDGSEPITMVNPHHDELLRVAADLQA